MKRHSSGNDIVKAMVVLGDFLLLNVILSLFFHFFPNVMPAYFKAAYRVVFVMANFAMVIGQYFFSPIIHLRHVDVESILRHVLKLAFLQAFAMFLFLRFLSGGVGFFRFMLIFGTAMFCALALARICERVVLARYRRQGKNTRRVIFIGSDPANLALYSEQMSDPSTGYKVIGYFAKEPMAGCPDALKRIGDMDTLFLQMAQADEQGAGSEEQGAKDEVPPIAEAQEVFCSLSHDETDTIVRLMRFCDRHVIHFYYVPRMFGNFRLNLQAERFGSYSIFSNRYEPLAVPGNRVLKRSFDVLVSIPVCLLMLPFIPLIALIIKRQSPGPVFFKQARTGMNGKTFTCYKFRSMHINSETDLSQATLDDPRKFPFGHFMRRTNIDEFPQFFNVLKGDMSLVGPRPHMLHHTHVYGQLIDKYMVRHFSKPGITGWAQVCGFRGETKELWQMEERIRHDIWYIENWTFWLDMKILCMTVYTLFVPSKNAY